MLRSRSERSSSPGAARLGWILVALVGLTWLSVAAAGAASLGDRTRQRFEIEVLSESLLLRPLDEASAVRAIELPDDDVVAIVNGKTFSESEVRAFLGADGELIGDLLALDAEERRAALGLAAEEESEAAGEGLPVPPAPPVPPRHRGHSADDRVSFGQSIHVAADESARDVVCIGCSIELEGHATGDTVAVGGSVRIAPGATVEGNAVAVGGKVTVAAGATVEGDAVTVGGTVRVEQGGTVEGQRSSVGWGSSWGGRHGPDFDFGFPFGIDTGFWTFFWSVTRAVLLALLACLFLLLARNGVERSSRRVAFEPWKAALAGLLTQLLFFPVLILVTVVLAVSIVGIPLLVLVPVAIVAVILGALLGYVAVAQSIGRWAARRFGWNLSEPYLVAIVGVLMIQAVSLLARAIGTIGGPMELVAFGFLFLGFFVKYLAWTTGLGAVMLATLGREWRNPAPAPSGFAPVEPAASFEPEPSLPVPPPAVPPADATSSAAGDEAPPRS